jgi:hypothetical protein
MFVTGVTGATVAMIGNVAFGRLLYGTPDEIPLAPYGHCDAGVTQAA